MYMYNVYMGNYGNGMQVPIATTITQNATH